MQYIILLTGCVNPDGMPFTTLTDISIREKQYIEAINFYLHNTDFPIVFAENSGTGISKSHDLFPDNKRLELLSYKGNIHKNKGKGYGEAEIINYALIHSHIITSKSIDCPIIKITGRLIVDNIIDIVYNRFIYQNSKSISVSYNSDFSFADSRIVIAPKDFYHLVIKHKEEINDFNHQYFENILSKCIMHSSTYHYYPFYYEPQITGQSGTTGEKYESYEPSFNRRLSYMIYALKKILLFDKRFSNCKLKVYEKITYYIYFYSLKGLYLIFDQAKN